MSGFRNPIIGGGGALVYPSIHSPNFDEATSTGWSIDKNGNLFAFNITATGTITSTTVVVQGTTGGVFVYSGVPANGNLICSMAGQAGTDGFGNAFPEGFGLSQGAIPGGLINAGTISTTQLAALAVNASKIANNTITTTQIAAAAGILGTQIAAATIAGSNLVAHTVTAGQIAANTITAAQIAASTITSGQIAAGTITGSNIAAGTITASNILAATITAAQIAAGTITAAQIAAGAIGTTQLAANAVTAAKIAANTITASQLAAGIVYAGIVDATTITGATIVADGSSGQMLIYSGTPASGNLIASSSGSSGTDSHGNSYVEGMAVYDPSTGNIGQLDAGQVTVTNSGASGGTGELRWTDASLSGTGGSSRNIAELTAIDTSTLQTIVDVIAPTGTKTGAVSIFGWEPTGAVELAVLLQVSGSICIGTAAPATTALLEVQGPIFGTGLLTLKEHAAPATPSGAGTIYVASDGSLHYKGPSGTDTKLANA